MLSHRDSVRRGRRSIRTLGLALLALLVVGTSLLAPRSAAAQMPQAAQVVASVTRWLALWMGQYILGRGVDLARERVRGASYRRQLVGVERTLRRRMSEEPSQRGRMSRELRLVERQIRMIDGVSNPAFDRDSARVYFGRVNGEMDELRAVVSAVATNMDEAWAMIESMRREIESLREQIAQMRRGGVYATDAGDVALQSSDDGGGFGLPSLPSGVRVGVGYTAALAGFTVPAYGSTAATAVNRRQQGASVRVGLDGGFLQFSVSASVLGAWLDSTWNESDVTSEPASRQPLQSVTVGADLSLALARRALIRPIIGGAVEQVWLAFRNLPGATGPDVVFSGLVYGPQAGLDLRIGSAFTVTLLGRMMTGNLAVPNDRLPGTAVTTSRIKRNQLVAVLSYSDAR